MNLLSPTTWTRVTFIGAGVLALAAVFVLVWFAGSRYGKHRSASAKDPDARATLKDRLLFAAALAAGATVYAGFVIGSYQGLTGFARDYLGWAGWLRNIVPVTLDGGAAAFAFLAFRAVARRKSPLRCYVIVWTAAGASASFNFIEGGADHTTWGGAYLAFLSLAGMSMFHTFLDQFRGAADLTLHPKFGLRWITYLPNTACAALAWTNHPVPDGWKPTLANAVAHLEQVRNRKRSVARSRRAERALSGGWTLRPWARSAALVLAVEAARAEAEQTAGALRILTDEVAAFRAERQAEQARLAAAEQEAEQLRAELAERSEQETIARAERALEHRPEQSAERLSDGSRSQRSSAGRSGRSATPERRPGAPKMTDAEALQVMLREHKEPDYEWGSREVNRLTGAGFGRIPKLIEMVAEHHAAQATEQGAERAHRTDRSTGSDDSEERAG